MKRVLTVLLALALGVPPAPAQQGSDPDPAGLGDRGAAARHQALLDLTNPFTVMCVACHPDDEDGATLTLERRKYGARTVTLFATSGEGGQNAVGPELYEELGRIRERETREASIIQGSEPYFLRLRDFGYSKTGDEAMRVWEEQVGGHEHLLEMFVAAIRRLRPDVIITNHDTKTQHGQHQATGRLLVEAFPLAGDPSRFPKAGAPWAPRALYLRARRDSKEGIALDVGAYDSVRGLTFREQAFRALLRHATQGPWQLESAPQTTRYVPIFPAPSGQGANIGSPLTSGLAAPAGVFRVEPREIEKSNHDALRTKLSAEVKKLELRSSRPTEINTEVGAALAGLFGVSIDLRLDVDYLMPGASTTPTLVVANGGAVPVGFNHIWSHGLESNTDDEAGTEPDTDRPLMPGEVRNIRDGKLYGETEPPPRQPAWSRNRPDLEISNMGEPIEWEPGGRNASVTYGIEFRAAGTTFSLRETEYLRVAPILRVTAAPRRAGVEHVSPNTSGPQRVSAESPAPIKLHIQNLSTKPTTFHLEQFPDVKGTLGPGEERVYEVNAAPGTKLQALEGQADTPDVRLLGETTIQHLVADVKVPAGLHVGYVRSYEYSIPEALGRLGVEHRELTPEAVRAGDLAGFDTIVIDNRAYLKYPELVRYNARLLEYVENGGNLIVFYHKDDEYDASLAPYPITLGRERITDENAPVEILAPAHPVFNFPNKIGPEDFRGWVQERGLYFPAEWDARYTPLLSSNDPGEKALAGGLLVAPHGKGTFVYTSYVWYRQLRGLVPGGYRVFANMISLPKAPK
jgi:LmbE family N-acetylglucosaminyl deacetylase